MNNSIEFLVILPNNLGDVIMATPVLEGLKAKYPECRIKYLVEEGFDGGLEGNPHCDCIIKIPRKTIRDTLRGGAWHKGVKALRNLLEDINTVTYDKVLNLSQVPYLTSLVPLIKTHAVVGQQMLREGNLAVEDDWSVYLYAIPFARRYNSLHATDVYRRIADVDKHNGYTVMLSEDERNEARSYLETKGVSVGHGKLMFFQVGAALSAKCWPKEHFVSLGKELVGRGWQIVVSGAFAEAEVAHEIARQVGDGCIVSAGETSFREAVANLSFADGLVTGDTALMHAGAALEVPVYALFGATHPVETGPYGDGHWVFSAGCSNRPCFCNECKTMICMKSILPETVLGCINEANLGADPICAVFRTALQPGGDYKLLPTGKTTFAYFDTVGAGLTRRLFDRGQRAITSMDSYLDDMREESAFFISHVRDMGPLLQQFLATGDSSYVRQFEECKKELNTQKGIGAFWAAVLNIRLNSVPMLGPRTAVVKSADVCMAMADQVQQAITVE